MNYYDLCLARGLRHHDVHTYLYTSRETKEESETFITVFKPFRGLYGKRSFVFRGLRFLAGAVWSVVDAKRKGICVAHLHYFQYGVRELLCCILLKAMSIRIVATAHDILPFSQPERLNLFALVLRLTDCVIVHNQYSAAAVETRVQDIDRLPPISVIHQGNYLDTVKPVAMEQARETLSLPKDRPVLLFFGQIKPEKGLEDLLRAFAVLKVRGLSALLVVAGRPMAHAREDYPRMVEALDVARDVIFDLRFIPDREATNYFSAADLVVLPYRSIYQSAMLLMAMSYGKPVLCSDLPPMTEIVTDGVSGFVFNAGEFESLANRLEQALACQRQLVEIGANAKLKMQRNYGWCDIGRLTKLAYRRALAPGTP